MANAAISASVQDISVSAERCSAILAKPVRTKRKSASAERCLRPLGATMDMTNPITSTSNRSSQGSIFAPMFTKSQLRGHGDDWAWRLTGNY